MLNTFKDLWQLPEVQAIVSLIVASVPIIAAAVIRQIVVNLGNSQNAIVSKITKAVEAQLVTARAENVAMQNQIIELQNDNAIMAKIVSSALLGSRRFSPSAKTDLTLLADKLHVYDKVDIIKQIMTDPVIDEIKPATVTTPGLFL
jgi:hypothetical protein